MVGARASEAPVDPRANGFALDAFTLLGAQTMLSIPAGDQHRRGTGRRLRWRSGNTRFDLDTRTGGFFLRGRSPGLRPAPGDAFTL